MSNQTIELGDRVKDPISGFSGIVICLSTWLHGCVRVGVAAENNTAKPEEAERHFDQARLVILDKGVHTPVIAAVVPAPPAPTHIAPGGPAREGHGFAR